LPVAHGAQTLSWKDLYVAQEIPDLKAAGTGARCTVFERLASWPAGPWLDRIDRRDVPLTGEQISAGGRDFFATGN